MIDIAEGGGVATSSRSRWAEEEGVSGVAELRPGCPFGTETDMRRAGGVLQRQGRRVESTLKPHPI